MGDLSDREIRRLLAECRARCAASEYPHWRRGLYCALGGGILALLLFGFIAGAVGKTQFGFGTVLLLGLGMALWAGAFGAFRP